MNVQTVDFTSLTAPEKFTRSLKDTGFAILSNHPIKFDLIKKVYDEWELFFNNQDKHNYIFDSKKQDGYFPYLSENAKGSNLKDLKEFYHIYPNGRYPNMISKSTKDLYTSLTEIAEILLSWIERNIPQKISMKFSMPLSKMVKNSPKNLLRIIHYPALNGNEKHGMVRAAAHGDINLLTVLVAGTEPGLQVQDINGEWHDVS